MKISINPYEKGRQSNRKMSKRLKQALLQEDIQIANHHRKGSREMRSSQMQIKIRMKWKDAWVNRMWYIRWKRLNLKREGHSGSPSNMDEPWKRHAGEVSQSQKDKYCQERSQIHRHKVRWSGKNKTKKTVLGIEGGDICTTMWTDLMPLYCMLKNS